MKIKLQGPYKELYKFAYLRKSAVDGRSRVDLVNSQSDRTTVSYAKYLMTIELGRLITDLEEVDHKDDDCSNDNISNLQVLTIEEHLTKTLSSRPKEFKLQFKCPVCNNTFFRRPGKVSTKEPKCSIACRNISYKSK